MGDSRIVNGTGDATAMKVDDNNRAHTFSVTANQQHIESLLNGDAFIANVVKFTDSPQYLPISATGGPFLIINNKSGKNLIPTRFLGTIAAAMNIWVHKFSTSQTPTANHRALDAANTRFDKPTNELVECWGWDGVGDGMAGITLTDKTAIAQLWAAAAGAPDVLINTWVVPPQSSVVFYAKSSSGVAPLTFLAIGYIKVLGT